MVGLQLEFVYSPPITSFQWLTEANILKWNCTNNNTGKWEIKENVNAYRRPVTDPTVVLMIFKTRKKASVG